MRFVDSNVLIDVLSRDENWLGWSLAAMAEATPGKLVINLVVMAEIAPGFEDLSSLRESLAGMGVDIVPIDQAIAFDAGRRFRMYRHKNRFRDAILSDFLIGAHASSLGATLLTRDTRIYRTYFPELALITPEDDNG